FQWRGGPRGASRNRRRLAAACPRRPRQRCTPSRTARDLWVLAFLLSRARSGGAGGPPLARFVIPPSGGRMRATAPHRTIEPDQLGQRYHRVRDATAALTQPLSDEDCVVQSMPDCSPSKWHLAHTTWFFETFVLERLPGYRLYDPA